MIQRVWPCIARSVLLTVALAWTLPGTTGCISAWYRTQNTAAVIDRDIDGEDNSVAWENFENWYLYPARDFLLGHWVVQARTGNRAWNIDANGEVPSGSFFENRDIAALTPEQLADPWPGAAPVMPLTVKKRKGNGTPGFVGKDARGRIYHVKLDDPDYPELGTAAEAIGSRVAWAMGYHVPPAYVITIEGTGEARYDGKRATAAPSVPGEVRGHWQFEEYKYRREIRAYKVVAMWINDIDHGDNNTLLTWDGQKAIFWMIDFNSSLGSWQGRPKSPKMGWVQAWDPMWQMRMFFTFGRARPQVDPKQPILSPAVGRFDDRLDAREWRTHQENPAYNILTQEDARWMAGRIGRLSEAQLAAIVHCGRHSDPADEAYVLKTLLARRERILVTFDRKLQDHGAGAR